MRTLPNMVSEPRSDPLCGFFVRRLGLRAKWLWFSEFVRGLSFCCLLWFLLEPQIVSISGTVAAAVPTRWGQRFWSD